jgi:hypothetical protein
MDLSCSTSEKMRPGFTIGHQAWILLAAGLVIRFGRWNKILKRERGGQWAMLFPGTLKNVTRVVLQQQQWQRTVCIIIAT